MDITLVLAVYNKLELTKEFYKNLRNVYPTAKLVISSAGSTDGSNEWLFGLKDKNLKYSILDNKISHSDNHNNAISLVDTDKLVLVHNDMIIGKYFLENLDANMKENIFLSYLTIEPPIYGNHLRAGKKIMDLGDSFENFNHDLFNEFVEKNHENCKEYDGGVFFLSGHKKSFDDVGGFDGKTFNPAFCEDDDFLIRAKLKGYRLKTTECAITYHFVSKTSGIGNSRYEMEMNSNRNFVRKWGTTISAFQEMKYWTNDEFSYNKYKLGLLVKDNVNLYDLEPFFDHIKVENEDFIGYVIEEQKNTSFDLRSKFGSIDNCDIIVSFKNKITQADLRNLILLRFIAKEYKVGVYEINNMKIRIINQYANDEV